MNSKPGNSGDLDRLYAEDYFHGVTSGYSSEGYRHCHPDWPSWLELVQAVQPGGLLLDLGCAYGYSIDEARTRGYDAFGCDISRFALGQEARLADRLVQGNLQRLPFSSGSADVVFVLDVLEHLLDPLAGLSEAVRLLAPDGLLVGATPDPLFFDRHEETHFSERPPSYWIHQLRRLGCSICFRFSVVPYNFQFLACREGSRMEGLIGRFQHDFFAESSDFVRAGGITAVPRHGWAPLADGKRRLVDSRAAVYLLNPDEGPRAASARLSVRSSGGFSTLRIRLDSWVLEERYLDSERTEHTISLDEFLIPAGGHHLFFDLFPGGTGVEIGDIEIETQPTDRARLTSGVPFDLFQRYAGAARLIRLLEPESLLDVGGCIGDEAGHLASSADFFSPGTEGSIEIVSSDLRQCDLPSHLPCGALEHPLDDGSFDIVVSLDVLEHIPPDRRRALLAELDRLARRGILLGAPFWSPDVERAEQQLSQRLLGDHTFLSEHRELGLPREELVIEYARERNYQVWSFPNGYLPSWLEMQALNALFFSLHRYTISQAFNTLYSRHVFERDLKSPSYRTIYLLIKGQLSPSIARALGHLKEAEGPPPLSATSGAEDDLLSLVHEARELLEGRDRALSDTQFLANARDEHIRLLMRERDALIRQLKETPLHVLAKQRWKQRRERGRDEGES